VSVTRQEQVMCGCGARLDVTVADSLNAGRHPHLRQALLDRKLHVFQCGVCRQPLVVEKDLLYVDFDRKQFFASVARHERYREGELARELRQTYDVWILENAPSFLRELGKDFLVRLCFGYEELREKIILDDNRLADLVIEALKWDVLVADPWFQENQVLTLRLDRVTGGELIFVPEWLWPTPFAMRDKVVHVKRAIHDEMLRHHDEIRQKWPRLASGPHVSLLRLIEWPRTTAPATSPVPQRPVF
jgi:hypothetical protein